MCGFSMEAVDVPTASTYAPAFPAPPAADTITPQRVCPRAASPLSRAPTDTSLTRRSTGAISLRHTPEKVSAAHPHAPELSAGCLRITASTVSGSLLCAARGLTKLPCLHSPSGPHSSGSCNAAARARSIDLSRNCLTSLAECEEPAGDTLVPMASPAPMRLSSFAHVTVLDVACNALVSLEGIGSMSSLRVLCAARNRLVDLSSLLRAAPPALQSVDVSFNVIRRFTDGTTFGPLQVRKLVLSCNHLTSLDSVGSLFPDLEELRVARNQIASAPSDALPQRLRSLTLAANYLSAHARRQLREMQRGMCQLRCLVMDQQREGLPSLSAEARTDEKPERAIALQRRAAQRTKQSVDVALLCALAAAASLRPRARVAPRGLSALLCALRRLGLREALRLLRLPRGRGRLGVARALRQMALGSPALQGLVAQRSQSSSSSKKEEKEEKEKEEMEEITKENDNEREGQWLLCVVPRPCMSTDCASGHRARLIAELKPPLRCSAHRCQMVQRTRWVRIDRRRNAPNIEVK